MKICKACQKEIHEQAYKCPYCQSFQSWKKNSTLWSWIPSVVVILYYPIFMYHMMMPTENYYKDFKTAISSQLVNKVESGTTALIYQIKNDADIKWTNIDYQITGKQSNGKIVSVANRTEYLIIPPHSNSALLSVNIYPEQPVTSWVFEITDMKSDRY